MSRCNMPVVIIGVGDILAYVLFAAIGRSSHHQHDGNALIGAAVVAAPFVAGWFAASIPMKMYRPAVFHSIPRTIRQTVLCGTLGWVMALIIRSLGERRLVPLTFATIALVVPLAFLLVWRSSVAFIVQQRHREDHLRRA